MKPPVLPAVRSWRSTETDGRLQNLPRAGGSGQNAALTAERVSASLWRISPLAVSDEGCDESDLVRVGNAAAFAAAGERSRTPPDIIPKPSAQRSACSPLARGALGLLSSRARGCARIERVRAGMTLDVDEFIRRFLIHVLPDGFHRIRHYGLFANGG